MKALFTILIFTISIHCFAQDWPDLGRYANENARLGAPQPGEKRVVFMGNSITEQWIKLDSVFFKERNYINRGISGQTSSQMLLRFRQDVIRLQPRVVVIAAGTNDIAENTGPISLENILGNIVSMTELAQANNIKVVLTSVLPAKTFIWRRHIQPVEKIRQLNEMIKAYAAQKRLPYVDYYSSMVGPNGEMRNTFSNDGVHPSLMGYKIMEPLVQTAIVRAMIR